MPEHRAELSEPGPNAGELLAALQGAAPSERLERLRDAGGPPLLFALGDEAERLAMVELNRGMEATLLVAALAERAGVPAAEARARRGRAKALAYAGRHAEALDECRRAVELADDAGVAREASLARLVSMQVLAELGRSDEAIADGEAARRALDAAGETALAARADVNLGSVYQRQGAPARALVHFDRAREILGGDPMAAGQIESNRGEALLALNDFAGAETAFRSALAIFERAEADWAAAIVEGNLADLATRQGRLERAMEHFERARRRLETDASEGHLARLLAEQADAMAVLGLPDDALAGYRSALESLDRCGLALEAARTRAGMGMVLLRMGQRAEAETALIAAASGFDALGHQSARARVDVIRAELAVARDRLAEARRLLDGALSIVESQPADAAVCRYHLSRLALLSGDAIAAETELAEAIAAAESLDIAPLHADLLHARGLARRAQGRNDAAVQDLQQSVELVERVRGSLQAARFRAAYLTNRLAAHQDLVTTVLDGDSPGATATAFSAVEMAKSRSLLDLMGGTGDLIDGPGDGAEPAELELAGRAARLRGEVNALYSRFAEPGAAETLSTSWRRGLRERERELDDVETRLATTRGTAGLYGPTVGLDEAQRLVPEGAVLIEYFLAGDELLAFWLDGDRTGVVRRLGSAKSLTERVRRFQFQVDRALRPGAMTGLRAARLVQDANAALRDLDALVTAPLRGVIDDAERLVIVPHGPLHLVPFAGLFDGKQHLLDRHEVQMAPSASVLSQLTRAQRRGHGHGAVVVGVPDETAPHIADEARSVAGQLGCDPMIGPRATAKAVVDAAAGAQVIHLACHGRFGAEIPMASGLRLADGWLRVRDIYPLRLRADLVVLSGCETGRNLVTAGDELMGLLRGFFAAGARSLLASLWRVHDESTLHLMTAFYDLWLAHTGRGDAAPALRSAQLALRDAAPHPALWAPFFLMGHP